MTEDPTIVVVGSGVAGAVAARNLAVDHDVRVLDANGIASGATGRSAGLVAPSLFFGDHPEVAHHANRFFRDFDGTEQFELTERPRLDLVTDDEVDEAIATAERRQEAGFPVNYLDSNTVTERHPRFRMDRFAGAIEYRDTGWVDPYSYTRALVETAEAGGAVVETGTRVTDVMVEDGEVAGVRTASGSVRADAVVVAAGWRTRDLLANYVSLPVRPYRTQCVVLDPEEPLSDDFPLVRVGIDHLYARPEVDGQLLVGGGRTGIDDPENATNSADADFERTVATRLPGLLSGFDRAGIVNGWAGVDGGTPDGYPIIDEPEDAPDGLVVATGFNGLGIMISPVVGPAVRETVTGQSAPFSLAPLGLARFDERPSEFSIQSTSTM